MRFLLSTLLTFIIFQPAHAESIAKQEVSVKRAYAYATMPGAQTGAAFMVLQNNKNSASADKLIGAESNIAEHVEIHENMIDPDDGTMMMRKIKSLDLPIGRDVKLKPDGHHIMLIDLNKSLTLNRQFPLTLIFEKAGKVDIDVNVVTPGLEPDESMDLTKNQQAVQNPVVKFFKDLFEKKEEPLY